jgi:hypothetical protein
VYVEEGDACKGYFCELSPARNKTTPTKCIHSRFQYYNVLYEETYELDN